MATTPDTQDAALAMAMAHLARVIVPVHEALRALTDAQARRIARLAHPNAAAHCVMPDEMGLLFDALNHWRDPRTAEAGPDDAPEARALSVALAPAEPMPPLLRLREALGLSPLEVAAVALCAAVEVEPAHDRILAFILDDPRRRQPCAELFVALGARLSSRSERRRVRGSFEAHAPLLRHGILEAASSGPDSRRRPLQLTSLARRFVLEGVGDPSLFRDPHAVEPHRDPLPDALDPPQVERIARALVEGRIDAVGVWGAPAETRARVIASLAARTPLRRVSVAAPPEERRWVEQTALALGEGVWVIGSGTENPERLDAWITSPVRWLVIDGPHPWRPARILTDRRHAEWHGRKATLSERRALWQAAFPDAREARIADEASRDTLGPLAVEAIGRMCHRAVSDVGGRPADHIGAARSMVTRRRSETFAQWIRPRRKPEDLILPPRLHARVMDVARFAKARHALHERLGWGSGEGVRALFTGPPGTGKTLSAEVIAAQLGQGLMRVDLARVVSKWVGETEKNLEAAFGEAEQSHAVLFFDEADALFGKRGEVKGGTDRYANLEVSFLLQRLERHDGVVLLASNLKQQIDPAFIRRLEIVAHFPRPTAEERRRMWATMLPADYVGDVDPDVLSALDMTGADIAQAVRTAAYLTQTDQLDAIGMPQLIRAIQRQFVQRSRVLRPGELGEHVRWLEPW